MPDSLTAVIVDDEPPARQLVREYLSAFERIDIVDAAGTGADAVRVIEATTPDLVFLDVQMPDGNGFDVLERLDLDPPPYIIFSTAYDEYAIQAFETGAVDYLLKPYKRDRFKQAVQRVLDRHDREETAADYADRLARLLQETTTSADAPDRLYVRHGEKILPVQTSAIQWVEAAGDYSEIHTADGTYLSSAGLGALNEHLSGDRFLRIHRSHLIALDAVDHLRSDGSGGYHVRLDDGTRLRVSRTYASEIRSRIV